MPEIITREEAREKSLKRYFTGKACKHGHVCERQTINGICMECVRQSQGKRRRDPATREAVLESDRKRRTDPRTRPTVLEGLRRSAAKLRATPEGQAYMVAYRSLPENKEARRIRENARYNTPQGRAIVCAKVARRSAYGGRATPPWLPLSDLADIWEGCPQGHEVDHLSPLTGRWWVGKLEAGDDPRWETRYDGPDGCTRVSSGWNVPWNLQYLPEAINTSKGNKRLAPNVFDWWTPIEAQEVRAAGPGEWSPGDGYD